MAAAEDIIEVHGTLPASLAGSWLAINTIKVKKGYINNWRLYRFSRADSRWQVQEYVDANPPELKRAIDAANKTLVTLEPDTALLKTLAGQLSSFKLAGAAERFKRVVFTTAEHLPQGVEPAPPPETKFSIEALDAGGTAVASGIAYYVQTVAQEKLSGETRGAVVANAGVTVVPFSVGGPFTMYRLE